MKQPLKNVVVVLAVALFVIGWVVSNYDLRSGLIYLALGGISFLVYANWEKISRFKLI